MKLKKELANSDEVKEQSGNGDGEEEETLKTFSPHTPSPSFMGKRKKKLKELMHVKSCDQSSKIIKKPPRSKSNKVLSDHASKSASSKKRVNSLSKTSAMVRAEEVISSLDPKFPTCLKTMVRSHVSSCFWMGLSTPFCKSYLPKEDMMLTVEDENGKEFEIKYLFERTGLSGGWKNFAIANKLLENDVVVFQLVKPLAPVKLKAYIIRVNDSANEDGATVNLDSDKQQNDAEKGGSKISENSHNTSKRKLFKSLQHDTPQKKKKTGLGKSFSKTLQQANKSKSGDEASDLEIIPGPNNLPKFQFIGVKSFEEFTIIADGLCIDSELPDHIRHKYYQLCSDKKAFLHARLMQDLNSKLIAGIIFETVSIADSIKKCNLTTCRSEFANWERALKSFHFMGMRVGFIIARIRKLVALAFESEDAIESRKYMAFKLERIQAEDELVNIKSKFGELKETYKKCGCDVKALKSKAETFEHKFQEEVDAPW